MGFFQISLLGSTRFGGGSWLWKFIPSSVLKRPPEKAKVIDVRKGVLGGLTPSLRLKIWADPPSWKIFEQVTP